MEPPQSLDPPQGERQPSQLVAVSLQGDEGLETADGVGKGFQLVVAHVKKGEGHRQGTLWLEVQRLELVFSQFELLQFAPVELLWKLPDGVGAEVEVGEVLELQDAGVDPLEVGVVAGEVLEGGGEARGDRVVPLVRDD